MAMPSQAVSHIQNTAPGPPRVIAVATPVMLPVPMVAASAIDIALKGGIWPSLPGSARRPRHSMRRP